jgi:hypothetical protein
MNREFQQYRFARIEGQKITRARLEAQFKDGIHDLQELEKAVEQQLTTETTCTPWRTSEVEQTGCREGMRMAALEFYWEHRRRLRLAIVNSSAAEKTTADRVVDAAGNGTYDSGRTARYSPTRARKDQG